MSENGKGRAHIIDLTVRTTLFHWSINPAKPNSTLWKAVVQIFVEHWGDNLQFYPVFNIGGMNLDQDFFQVSKLREDQKIGLHQKWNTFFPRIQVKTKHFFSPISREDQ